MRFTLIATRGQYCTEKRPANLYKPNKTIYTSRARAQTCREGKYFLDLCFWQNIGMFCTYLFSVILYTESYSNTLSLLDFLKKIGAYKSRRDSQSRSLVMEWRPQFRAECYAIDHHKSIVKDLHNIRRGVQYLYALWLMVCQMRKDKVGPRPKN